MGGRPASYRSRGRSLNDRSVALRGIEGQVEGVDAHEGVAIGEWRGRGVHHGVETLAEGVEQGGIAVNQTSLQQGGLDGLSLIHI